MAENNNKVTPDFLTYNKYGLKPIESAFHLDCKTLENIVFRIIAERISGVEDVKIQTDNKTGSVGLFAWFRSSSDHFNDRSTENTMIKSSLDRLSKEMQAFLQDFGWSEGDDRPETGNFKVHPSKIMVTNTNPEVSGKWTAIHLAINPFLEIIFDIRGEEFRKEFSQNPPRAKLRRDWMWSKGPSGKYHSLNGLKVVKKVNNPTLSRAELHARWGGKF